MAKPIDPGTIPTRRDWLPLLDAFLASGDAAWELEPADLGGVEPKAAAIRLGNAARDTGRPVRAAKRGDRVFLLGAEPRRRETKGT